jgi:outer membrane protein TolC
VAVACLFSIAVLAAPARAQTPPVPPGPLTLEQVLTLAESRSETVAIARSGITRAEGEAVRARSGLYPQLSASATYERALASEFEGVFGGDAAPACPPFALNPQASIEARVSEIERAVDCGAIGGNLFGGGTGAGADGESDGDGGLEDLPFGRENTWRVSLAFSQNVFSGGRIGAQRALANVGRETAELGLTTARAQLLFDVTQAYYDAALSERLVTIAEASREQAGATLLQTQAGFDAGTQPEFEVLRARVTRDNQTPVVIRQRVNRDIAFLRLKQLLDLPPTYELRLADSLGGDLLAPAPMFAPQVAAVEVAMRDTEAATFTLQADAPMPDRTAIAEAGAGVRLREASLRLAEAQRMPSVSLTSNYSRVAYPSGFAPIFDRTNWTVGASVNVPLLTGGRQRGDEAVARAELDQAKLQLQRVQELAAVDTRAAWAELLAARAAWEASAGTVQQANRAFEIATVRYGAGVSTQLELSDSRLLLQQAEANRAQAARDLQVARARVALLPNLPLGGGSGTGGAAPRAPQQPVQPQTPSPAAADGQLRNASAQGAQRQAGF